MLSLLSNKILNIVLEALFSFIDSAQNVGIGECSALNKCDSCIDLNFELVNN